VPRWSKAGVLVVEVAFAIGAGSLLGVAGAQTSPTVEPSTSATEPTTTPTTAPPPTSPTTAVPDTTAPAPPVVGNSQIEASVLLRFCPSKGCNGEHVFLDSASNHPYPGKASNCTKDEKGGDFYQKEDAERRAITMIATTGGTCSLEASYNVWVIEAYLGNVLQSRGYVWVGKDGAGPLFTYYAKCYTGPGAKNFTCAKGQGPLTLTVGRPDNPLPPQVPSCPAAGPQCYISVHFDSSACPNFQAPVGLCAGKSTGANAQFVQPVFDAPLVFAGFMWGSGSERLVSYGATTTGIRSATIEGHVRGSKDIADFRVSDAFTLLPPNAGVHWTTVDRPGVGAGAPGGPLLLEFKNGIVGADVYISGYLEPKR
jgi:hypothetical protein